MNHAIETLDRALKRAQTPVAGTYLARRLADGSIEVRLTTVSGQHTIGPVLTLPDVPPLIAQENDAA